MRRAATMLIGVSVTVFGQGPNAGDCRDLEGAQLAKQVDYLRQDRSSLDAACIVSALFQISAAANRAKFDGYEKALETLAEYLDYRPPESKLAAALSHSRHPFPAWDALFFVGRPAMPYVIDLIANTSTPDVARDNAITLVYSLYIRDNLSEGVRILKRASEARVNADWDGSRRLLEAARKAAELCTVPNDKQCTDAHRVLYEPPGK